MTQNNGNSSSGSSTSSLPRMPGEERLMVAVRVRPTSDVNEPKCVKVNSKKSLLLDDAGKKEKPRRYLYDYVFSETSTQEEVYQATTSPLIKDVLNGLNAAVFAYGSTGAGKTHTMLGPNPKKAATPSSEESPPRSTEADGLMVRAIVEIFKFVEQTDKSTAFRVSLHIFVFLFYKNTKSFSCRKSGKGKTENIFHRFFFSFM